MGKTVISRYYIPKGQASTNTPNIKTGSKQATIAPHHFLLPQNSHYLFRRSLSPPTQSSQKKMIPRALVMWYQSHPHRYTRSQPTFLRYELNIGDHACPCTFRISPLPTFPLPLQTNPKQLEEDDNSSSGDVVPVPPHHRYRSQPTFLR